MKATALLTIGAFMVSGSAFAAVTTDAKDHTLSVKSNTSAPVIVASGKQRVGNLGSGLSNGRTIFGG
jgi:hypothetical protein